MKLTGVPIGHSKYINKRLGAKECLENGVCLECGCNTNLMLLSSKPCPKRTYSPDEKPCY